MFRVSDLNNKYEYNFSVKRPVTKTLSDHLDKKDPFQMTDFINQFVTANEWKWDEITFYNCKRIEFLIQEKLPSGVIIKKEVYRWLVNNWRRYYFPGTDNVSLN